MRTAQMLLLASAAVAALPATARGDLIFLEDEGSVAAGDSFRWVWQWSPEDHLSSDIRVTDDWFVSFFVRHHRPTDEWVVTWRTTRRPDGDAAPQHWTDSATFSDEAFGLVLSESVTLPGLPESGGDDAFTISVDRFAADPTLNRITFEGFHNVPEPGTLMLLGLCGLAGRRRRR